MQQQAAQSNVLETVFSGPGAVFAICITAIVILCLLTFSPRLQNFIRSLKIKLGSGSRRFEISPADQPVQDLVEESGAASVTPPATEEVDERPESQRAGPRKGELPLKADDEISLHTTMYIAAFDDKDADEIDVAYRKLKALEGRRMSNEVLETLRSRLRLETGIQAGEYELKELEKKNATWVGPSLALAQYFRKLSRHDLAKLHAEKAIERSESDSQKSLSYKELAEILIQLDAQADALKLLNNALSKVAKNEAKASILDKVAEIHETANDDQMATKALEHAMLLTPSDKGLRFKLAYLYFQHNRDLLALFHYKILADQDASYSSTLNNLGAVYDRLKLPVKCVETWRRAANWGQPYPMGNLAIGLIKRGYFDEARKVLDNVPLEARGDVRVADAIRLMDSTGEREDEELKKYLEAVKIHHKYMLLSVEVEQNPELQALTHKDLIGNWASAGGAELELSLSKDGSLQAVSTEPEISGALGGIFGPMKPPSRNAFNLNLEKNGLVLSGTAFPIQEESQVGLLGLGRSANRNYFLVVTSRTNISGLYWSDDTNPQEISFDRS